MREGRHHSASETHYTLERVLPCAAALTQAPLLVRKDSGFDSTRLLLTVAAASQARQAQGGAPIELVCQWNPRGTDVEALYAVRLADADAVWGSPRPGKRITLWEERLERRWRKQRVSVRRLLRLTERTVSAEDQALLVPELALEGWDTTLAAPPGGGTPAETAPTPCFSAEQVIALYADHATHEQFPSRVQARPRARGCPRASSPAATGPSRSACSPTTACA